MNTKRVAAAALLAAAVASLPLAPASAQRCYYPNDWIPLAFPFGVAAAIVDTALSIATLPLALVTAPAYAPVYPPYGTTCASPYYGYPPGPASGPPYSGYGYYGPR